MGWISAPRRQVAGPLQQRGAAAARRELVVGAVEAEAGWPERRSGFEIGCAHAHAQTAEEEEEEEKERVLY